MPIAAFEVQMDRAQRSFRTIHDHAGALPESHRILVRESLEELSASLEGLRTAHEELTPRASFPEITPPPIVDPESMKAVADQVALTLERLRLLETAKRRASELEAIFEALHQPIIIFDAQGKPTKMNQSALTAFGIDLTRGTAEDYDRAAPRYLPRRLDGRALTPEELPSRRALRGETVKNERLLFTDSQGGDLIYEASGIPLFEKDRVEGAVAIWHEVTDREQLLRELERERAALKQSEEGQRDLLVQLEAERNRWQTMLESITDCYYALDREWRFIEMNERAAAYFGLRREDFLGRIIWEFMPRAAGTFFERRFHRAMAEGAPEHFDSSSPVIEGRSAEIHVYPSPAGLRVYFRDITERKKMEEEIRRSRDELGIKVRERTAELERSTRQLTEQSKILESFFQYTLTPLVFLKPDFSFIRVNQAYADACQRRVSDFPGRNHFEFYPHEENEAIFRQVVETKRHYKVTAKPFFFPDHPEWGVTYWNWTLTPILGDRGEVEFLVFSLEDVTEQSTAKESLQQSVALLRTVLETLPIGVWITDKAGRLIEGNPAGQQVWAGAKYVGLDQYGEYKGWWLDTGKPIAPDEWAAARALTRGETSLNEEVEIECFDGTHKIIYNSAVPLRNSQQEITGVLIVNQDISEVKETERRTRATNALLRLFAEKTQRKEYLEAIGALIHEWCGCCNIGIRVLDASGNIPYESHIGFSRAFCASENWLSIHEDQCACIRVVKGALEPQDVPMTTPQGSFRCDHTVDYVSSLSEKEQARFRGVCVQNGFLSVAIIPIHYQGKMLGAIHLADEKEGMVPLKTVAFIESMIPLIGEAIHRFGLESDLQRNFDAQSRISSLLRLSLEDLPLEEILTETLNLLLSFPWLEAPRGCIYLVEEEPARLNMKAQKGLSDSMGKPCRRLSLDRSLCGPEVLQPEVCFIPCRPPEDGLGDEEATPHAHYLAPLSYAGRSIGLIDIYLEGGPIPNQEENKRYLRAIADTLAGIVVRKQGERAIKESETRLRLLSSQLLTSQEDERKRIAREVHDQLGSYLSAIKFKIEDVIQGISKRTPQSHLDTLAGIVPIIQETITETRRIQSDLRPPLLDDLGILATFSWFCRRFQTIYSEIRVKSEFNVREEEVPDPLKIVLFRITQEAMNNISKHARADRVLLSLGKGARQLILTIQDNGEGFDLEALPSRDISDRGMGLSSMKERAEISGGSVRIHSVLGEGTVIQATWPL